MNRDASKDDDPAMKPEDDGAMPGATPSGEAVNPRDKPRRVTGKIRERRKREAAADVTGDTRKLVVFQLGEEYFALDAREVVEIVPIADITWVPGCPDEILGVMNVRGNIESILEPHRLMGLTFRGVTPQSRVIIAAAGGVQSGILVDMVQTCWTWRPISSRNPWPPCPRGSGTSPPAGKISGATNTRPFWTPAGFSTPCSGPSGDEMAESPADRVAEGSSMASRPEGETAEFLELLLFERENLLFAVDMDQVEGILDMDEAVRRGVHVYPLTLGMSGGAPGASPVTSSPVTPRGEALPEKPSDDFRIFLIRDETPPRGVAVPRPREMLSVPLSHIYPMPDFIGRLVPGHPVWALAGIGDRKALVLDCYRLIVQSRPVPGRP